MAIDNDQFILDPVGTRYEFNNKNELIDFLHDSGFDRLKMEAYCPVCKKERLFERELLNLNGSRTTAPYEVERGEIFRFAYSCICGEVGSCFEIIIGVTEDNTIIKVGQYPDSAIFDKNVNNKLFSSLKGDYKTYYQNAIKSRRNNCYIGAFNYLRRIFEALISEAEKEYNIISKKDDTMKKRTKALISKGAFDEFLIGDNLNSLYSLLSEGLHNLTEETCEKHYQILHLAIETILEDKNSRKEREKRKEKINKAIGKIGNEVFNKA